MNERQTQNLEIMTSEAADDPRAPYQPPELMDLGDVGNVTNSGRTRFGGESGYS